MLRQQARPMMGMVRAGFLTTNSPYGKSVKDKDFTKVVLFAGQLGI